MNDVCWLINGHNQGTHGISEGISLIAKSHDHYDLRLGYILSFDKMFWYSFITQLAFTSISELVAFHLQETQSTLLHPSRFIPSAKKSGGKLIRGFDL